jgi:hypothetical protein
VPPVSYTAGYTKVLHPQNYPAILKKLVVKELGYQLALTRCGHANCQELRFGPDWNRSNLSNLRLAKMNFHVCFRQVVSYKSGTLIQEVY